MAGYLERVTADAAALAAAVHAAPSAPVGCYDGWTLVELGGHVGKIHRWVSGIVQTQATERPSGGYATPPAAEGLADWLVDGARRLVDVLGAAEPSAEVWTFSRTHADVAFWRRRMALETALHRWDAEDALDRDAVVDEALAREGVEETLRVYLEQRLDGRDVGGSGQRVAFVPQARSPDEGGHAWTLVLRADGVAVEDGHHHADAMVYGSALELWLLLTCRRPLDGLQVDGDRGAATHAVRAAHLVPGPAG